MDHVDRFSSSIFEIGLEWMVEKKLAINDSNDDPFRKSTGLEEGMRQTVIKKTTAVNCQLILRVTRKRALIK